MFRCLLILSAILLAAFRGEAALDFASEIRPLVESYCFKCHGEKRAKADLRLDESADLAGVYQHVQAWDKALAELTAENMPPDDKPQPTPEEREKMMSWLRQTLNDPAPDALPPDPGRPFLHRLSHTEYNHTIRDLLGVTSNPVRDFPPDGGGGGGFDNNSATLFIPPILMEKYLSASAAILAEAQPERFISTRPGDAVSKADAGRQSITDFVARAFRRPIEPHELDQLTSLFARLDGEGLAFDDSMRGTLRAVLVSPNFLFRVERPNGTEPQPISDYELASRLSYFLWSSMPDDELFQLASENKLHDPATLEAQVKRMLRDPKARALAENFAGQWLRVHELDSSANPDPGKFPEYSPELRADMIAEPIEFFHALLREDGSLLDLIDSDYTWLNERLARHYGIETSVEGENFRRVSLPDHHRGGVMTMGAVLTLTSYPQRTSPVLRGKWILEEILGSPPPPPPSMIKSLPTNDRVRDGLTFRQQLEQHRKDANCAGCHSRLDPPGFGLENFDPIGRWRTEIAGQPADASGEMATGEKFNGPIELKKVLLQRKDEFLRNVASRMYAYALNRGLEYYDVPIVRRSVRSIAQNDYRASALIMEIVRSYPFQHRRGTEPTTAQN